MARSRGALRTVRNDTGMGYTPRELDVKNAVRPRRHMDTLATRIEERDDEHHTGGRAWLARMQRVMGEGM